MFDPFLTVLIKRIRRVLLRGNARNVLALDFLYHLYRIIRHVHQRSHNTSILHGPIRSNKGQEVGEFRNAQAEISFGTDLPLIGEVDAVLADDGEARAVRDVKAGGAYDRVDFAMNTIFADHTCLVNLHYFSEVNVDVRLLDCSARLVSGEGFYLEESKLTPYTDHQALFVDNRYRSLG